MSDDDLRYASIETLGRRYRSGDLSPVEVVRAHLDAIDALNDRTHDYITVTRARAIADAEGAEAAFRSGQDRGPLQGIPVALKDLVDVKGVATTAGVKIRADHVAETDATVARRLSTAGSVLLGKTNLVAFAFGPYGLNPQFGTPPNPWGEDRVPGGSSSGSAGAVARGCAVAAIGTDTGGSIRVPASFCGIVGLKPTVPRVSRAGVVPLSWTLDSVGPLTRSVMDAAHVFDAISGFDPSDPVTAEGPAEGAISEGMTGDVRGVRVGIAGDPFFEGADADVAGRVEAAAETLSAAGAVVEEIDFPEAREELDAEIDGRGSVAMMCVEGFVCHQGFLEAHGDDVDPIIRERIEKGRTIPAADYARALRDQRRLRRSAVARLSRIDAVLAPTTLTPAPPVVEVSTAPARLTTRLVNYLGFCAVSIPCGPTAGGLPAGLQLIGKPFDERIVLNLALAYERSAGPPAHPTVEDA